MNLDFLINNYTAIALWMALVVIFIGLKLCTDFKHSLWFALFASISMIIACFSVNPLIQIIIFILLSSLVFFKKKPQSKNTSHLIIYKMILTALFAALSFAGLSIKVPVPTGSYVHLGNFFCILGGLLCGGLVGGFAGAIGMTIGDLISGYIWTTWLRTLIVKFLMGFISGSLFHLVIKKKLNTFVLLIATNIISAAGFVYCLIMFFSEKYQYGYLPLAFTAIFLAISIFALIFAKRLKNIQKAVIFSILIAVIVNILGEFILRMVFSMILGTVWDSALATSIMKLPASIINGVLTMIFITIIYYPLYKATYKINRLNDLPIEL